jgi:RNA polymerase subunit RPABC4/transcription elongation factor Spt4
MQCPECGAEIQEEAKFCPSCGTKIEYSEEKITEGQKRLCPNCGAELSRDDLFCGSCGTRIGESVISPVVDLWHQDFYRIRKEDLTGLTGLIENREGNILGFYKSILFGLPADVRIYSVENRSKELFYVKRQHIFNYIGRYTYSVIDSHTNALLGYIKMSVVYKEGVMYNTSQQPIGMIYLAHAGKYVLVLGGTPVAEVNQESKIWEINCQDIPDEFDHRILLSCILHMGVEKILGILLLPAYTIFIIIAFFIVFLTGALLGGW